MTKLGVKEIVDRGMVRYKPLIWFVIIGLFLCGQFIFSIKVEEPYPCIRFPGFGPVPQTDSIVEIVNYGMLVHLSNGQKIALKDRQHFPTIPDWFVPFMSKNLILKEEAESDLESLDSFKEWLQVQLSSIFQAHTINAIEFEQYRHTFKTKNRSIIKKEITARRMYKFE